MAERGPSAGASARQDNLSNRMMAWRALFVVPMAGLCLWGVSVVGIATSQGRDRPALAHATWPIDARAAAAQARAMLLRTPKRETLPAVRELAIAALRRDPTVLAAYNVLGLAADMSGQKAKAERVFRYAHRLSRRDLATELWLIEAGVARNDVPSVLDHFDAAMSGATGGWEALSPVLLGALDDPQLVIPIARLTARNRWWNSALQWRVATEAPSLVGATRFFLQLRANGVRSDPDTLQALATRLVAAGRLRDARALDVLVGGTNRQAAVRDGGFDKPGGLTPFQWEFPINERATAQRTPRIDRSGDVAVSFTVDGGFKNILARQLIALQPGTYNLSAETMVEQVDGEWSLGWSVSCGNDEPTTTHWPASNRAWTRHGLSFTVPNGCPFQWIIFSAEGGRDASRLVGWLDSVNVSASR